jgi:uncharacterized protein YqhQ
VAEPVTYGGQAVIEGVMMRGPRYFAVACRRANGEITLQQEAVPAFFTRYKWAKWPFMRGVFALADAMVLGMKTLIFSANLAMEDEKSAGAADGQEAAAEATAAQPVAPEVGPLTQALCGPLYLMLGVAAPAGKGSISGIAVTGSAFVGMAFGIGLFMLFPSWVAGLLTPWLGGDPWPALVEGVIRVALVLGYIALIGRMAHVQRLFQYHGAEHKTINAWELEGKLDLDAVMRASRLHPRCGTNFVLTVLLVKMVIFTMIPFGSNTLFRLGLRLAMLPIVASIAYELIRLAGKYRNVAPLQWIVLPGRFTQLLTTREPAPEMGEVAIASLKGVMEREAADKPAG